MENKKRYLGDGLYVEWNGLQFVLKANDIQFPTDTVYLELHVLRSLIEFAEDNLEPKIFKAIIK